jgi:hypothetical protein
MDILVKQVFNLRKDLPNTTYYLNQKNTTRWTTPPEISHFNALRIIHESYKKTSHLVFRLGFPDSYNMIALSPFGVMYAYQKTDTTLEPFGADNLYTNHENIKDSYFWFDYRPKSFLKSAHGRITLHSHFKDMKMTANTILVD